MERNITSAEGFTFLPLYVCLSARAGKNRGFITFFVGFRFLICFTVFLSFYLTNAGHKITTHKQRFGHVNATNRNSYLNIICIKLVTQMKKK